MCIHKLSNKEFGLHFGIKSRSELTKVFPLQHLSKTVIQRLLLTRDVELKKC